MPELLTRPQVEERMNFSTSHLYSLVRKGAFPKPLKISRRCVRWRVTDIDDYLKRLAADRDAAV